MLYNIIIYLAYQKFKKILIGKVIRMSARGAKLSEKEELLKEIKYKMEFIKSFYGVNGVSKNLLDRCEKVESNKISVEDAELLVDDLQLFIDTEDLMV